MPKLPPERCALIGRDRFIRQFVDLSKILLKDYLKEEATETDHMEVACQLLHKKFKDALGVVHDN